MIQENQQWQRELLLKVVEYWEVVETTEKGLLQTAKTIVSEYLERYARVYQKGPGADEAEQIWYAMSYDSKGFFKNIWRCATSDLVGLIDEVYDKRIESKGDMDELFRMEWLAVEKTIDSIYQLLIVRKYVCWSVRGKECV